MHQQPYLTSLISLIFFSHRYLHSGSNWARLERCHNDIGAQISARMRKNFFNPLTEDEANFLAIEFSIAFRKKKRGKERTSHDFERILWL